MLQSRCIRIYIVADSDPTRRPVPMVFNADNALMIRHQYRMHGAKCIGSVPDDRCQNKNLMLPMCILWEEALLLCRLQVAIMVKESIDKPLQGQSTISDGNVVIPYESNDSALEQIDYGRFIPDKESLDFVRMKVYERLWSRGYYLSSGLKFGCDFLVYDEDSSKHHAFATCFCVRPTQDLLRGINLSALARLASRLVLLSDSLWRIHIRFQGFLTTASHTG
ncbi:hypothetical protein ACOME3_004483 [Neoechinorhynchus agilis]